MASVTITRDSGYADKMRKYAVLIDGNKVGEIGNGETKGYEVAAGHHTIRLKIDWCGSKPIEVSVKDGDHLAFNARSSLRGNQIALVLWYTFIARDEYIILEPVCEMAAQQ